VLKTAASLMRARKNALSALIIREAGKSWREADADVAEAIDFCDYYADCMLKLAAPVLTQEVPGEENFYFYQSRGVCAVIAPWNFPFAIACGMATAALVAGNVVALKPSEQTGAIAQELALLLFEAGLPKNALAFLPGRGEVIGRHLVQHPLVDMVVFTGSKPVGLEILRETAEVRPGQRNLKKVVAELGGKNAIIVDEDADLDEAIKGILSSAFGFSGQKCSACSRVIAVGDCYEPLLRRLSDAARDVIVGAAAQPATLVGPVIDAESQARILGVIARAESEHTLAFKGKVPSDSGYFVPPSIFKDVSTESSLWREEVFGPVVACAQAPDFTTALEMANASEYALTGGVFSRSPAHLEQAKRHFKVGNLYLNRGCTGALVGRQPFGGFRMSGVGSKAGGPDYLLQFLEPRTVTENTMRRGFAP
jgi:RHH-type proline utilization regulon transcriptional repressor/proline dehydrogenase/delta 1-pyrroline-5-carboxylate dehydrogenase